MLRKVHVVNIKNFKTLSEIAVEIVFLKFKKLTLPVYVRPDPLK